jgi:hypothetical protein
MTLMTTLILVLTYAMAAAVLFGIFAGIPLWMIRTHPDTVPDTQLPEYLRADWNEPPRPGAGRRRPQTRSLT